MYVQSYPKEILYTDGNILSTVFRAEHPVGLLQKARHPVAHQLIAYKYMD